MVEYEIVDIIAQFQENQSEAQDPLVLQLVGLIGNLATGLCLFGYDLVLSVVGSVETKKAIMSSPLVDMVVTWMSERDEKLSAQCGMKWYSQIRGFLFTGNLCFPCSLVSIAGLIIFCSINSIQSKLKCTDIDSFLWQPAPCEI